ncbi:MAG: hypothetical protein DIU82_08835, partial [Bacillota bacterium]
MLRCLYVVAEAQLVHTLRRAAALLDTAGFGLSVALEGYTVEELTHLDKATLERQLAAADVFIGSMLNSEREVAMLAELLAQRRPPVTVVFTSQPELMLLSRLGAFDAQAWVRDPGRLHSLAQRLRAAGAPAPPSPAGLLAALPRLVSRFGPDVLGEAWAY